MKFEKILSQSVVGDKLNPNKVTIKPSTRITIKEDCDMRLISKTTAILSVLTIASAVVAEEFIPASFLPAQFNDVISNIGDVGEIPLDANTAIPLDDINQISTTEDFSISLESLNSLFDDGFEIGEGEIVQAEHLNQVIASSNISTIINGNYVEIQNSVNPANTISNAFTDVQVPVMVSQNYGTTSTLSQTITMQIGIEVPATRGVTQ